MQIVTQRSESSTGLTAQPNLLTLAVINKELRIHIAIFSINTPLRSTTLHYSSLYSTIPVYYTLLYRQ